jgi:hypothetical protein
MSCNMNTTQQEFWSINLYYYILNIKKMDEDLTSKITGMLIEDEDVLVKFSEHEHNYIDGRINEALNVLIEYKPDKTSDLREQFKISSLKIKAREYLKINS